MNFKSVLVAAFVVVLTPLANADLTPWTDYEVSESVWSITTVRVNANMGDAYLEGIKKTWAAGNDVAMELGQVEDWKIMRSDLPQSGDFNLLLMVKFKNTEALGPSKKRYDAFMQKWGEERNKETTEFAQKNYPAMRELTGSYYFREIELK